MIITLQTLVYFRESLLRALDRLLRPYYTSLSLTFGKKANDDEDDDSDEQVFAEFDDEKGVVFFPPMYLQRYAAVSDCLMDERWSGQLEKVVDLGYHDMSFIKYLKEVPGVKCILGVDIESMPLRCSSDLIGCNRFTSQRDTPLHVTLFEGNAADPDYRLIGCDAVVAIEMIEHMLPHDLDRLVHTVFGFTRPRVAIFTTPNGDFNVLFKSLEKNGLRRWDHFFEWSREQFNDWCSNIVLRYPDYTVICKGIGPGPPGTLHLGCCSQMAVFTAKEYHKQQDLNMNSLALVANRPQNINDLISSWDTSESVPSESNMLCPPNEVDSYTDLYSEVPSCMTLVLPPYSTPLVEREDKTSQCNLDKESGKNYLFDYEQMSFNTVIPRRMYDTRCYVIEDVACRLNCSTLLANKFTKTTQHLISMDHMDPVVHTREVVDEIRHITKMLNFNKNSIQQSNDNTNIWSNINWGENAPYWNQFYNVVREYSYPFESKSDECRIVDLVSEEINKLIDMQYDEDYSVDVNKFEIPIEHLMRVVAHITTDVDKVKDLLEWNGYEVVDNLVIHSRLVVDNTSVAADDDWADNDTSSDWDSTDFRSTSVSDASTIVPDYHARCLRRALDRKVRKLRSMLTADQDVTVELDRIVCRLMKLALRTSRGRRHPPPTRWMQCKLLDLLTLTEKAICRRKKYFIENYPLNAIGLDPERKSPEMHALEKIKNDDTAVRIFSKYRHLVNLADKMNIEDFTRHLDWEYKDDVTIGSPEFENDQMFDDGFHNKIRFYDMNKKDDISGNTIDLLNEDDYLNSCPEAESNFMTIFHPKDDATDQCKLERTQAWLEEDVEVVPYPNHDANFENSSGDTDNSTSNPTDYYKKTLKRFREKAKMNLIDIQCAICKRSHTKCPTKQSSHDRNFKAKPSTSRLIKKDSKKKSSYNNLLRNNRKYASNGYRSYRVNKHKKEYKSLQPTASKPIPSSLIELCHPDLGINASVDICNDYNLCVDPKEKPHDVAATEDSQTIEIVTDELNETVSLKRNIGTDADCDSVIENETLIRSVSNTIYNDIGSSDKQDVTFENGQAQTIFLYDINEPTTSKGIRHCSMDVQCGPDITATPYSLSVTTSLTRLPKMFSAGIKIDDSSSDTKLKNVDCSTSTEETEIQKIIAPREKSVGIVIKDSGTDFGEKYECSTMTHKEVSEMPDDKEEERELISGISTETKLLKSAPSTLNADSCSGEFRDSNASSPLMFKSETADKKEIGVTGKFSKYERPRLCCGGVQVHSYGNKQTSEDIMYQGEWQRQRPKVLTKRKVFTPAPKKTNDAKKTNSNNGLNKSIPVKRTIKKIPKVEQKPPLQVHNVRIMKSKQENKAIDTTKKSVSNPKPKNVKQPFRNVSRVPSKPSVSYTKNKNYKNVKSTFVVRKPSVISNIADTKEEKPQKVLPKSYIPVYLRRNKSKSQSVENKNFTQIRNKKRIVKPDKNQNVCVAITRSKTDIKVDLLKFQTTVTEDYLVLRNEIENKSSASDEHVYKNINENIRKRDTINRRALSPQSPNSSTCSSPNSVATVRAVTVKPKTVTNRKHSTSSYKSNNIVTSESESTPPVKTPQKKLTKRCKSAKQAEEKGFDNKENIPQSSKQSKSPFAGSNKIYIAQLKGSPILQSTLNKSSKNKLQKSNINMPRAESVGRKKSANSTDIIKEPYFNDDNTASQSNENSNKIVIWQKPTDSQSCSPRDNPPSNVVINHRLITDWIDNANAAAASHKGNIATSMKMLIEETLDFIDDPYDSFRAIDSETVVLSNENLKRPESNSPESYKTVITNDENLNESFQSDLIEALNNSFDMSLGGDSFSSTEEPNMLVTDFDVLSFKSIVSISKPSDQLDDCSLESEVRMPLPLDSKPVCDIFERKDQLQDRNNAKSSMASQVFSGFSINEEAIPGDQPDSVNFIDSETGSLAVNRQITSEELFISGRSSGSFESCVIDEDAVVPNWLFQIISQQQSSTDELQPPVQLMVPISLPINEGMLDANGNIVEGVGVGAGAGDGRGIHSDNSQDSSGRGTSSSSDTSSGPQSETIIIDPSAFAAQFEMLREPVEDPGVLLSSSSNNEIRPRQAHPLGSRSFSHGESSRNPRLSTNNTSDFDADESSLDTDVHDSSDNLQ